ncbi:DUF6479 family protein [uncultured Methylobacterium sp.]|uniref:DUF6479 family protein n=1 Tax=uncultured Methylobacterium sp. TaxID=157278 RepID=UPI0033904349|nr:DUF6479 family protein [Methylobacterium sp.]
MSNAAVIFIIVLIVRSFFAIFSLVLASCFFVRVFHLGSEIAAERPTTPLPQSRSGKPARHRPDRTEYRTHRAADEPARDPARRRPDSLPHRSDRTPAHRDPPPPILSSGGTIRPSRSARAVCPSSFST